MRRSRVAIRRRIAGTSEGGFLVRIEEVGSRSNSRTVRLVLFVEM